MRRFLFSLLISGILIGTGIVVTTFEFMDWKTVSFSEVNYFATNQTYNKIFQPNTGEIIIYSDAPVKNIDFVVNETLGNQIQIEVTGFDYQDINIVEWHENDSPRYSIEVSYYFGMRDVYKMVEYCFKNRVFVNGSGLNQVKVTVYGSQELLNRIVLRDYYYYDYYEYDYHE